MSESQPNESEASESESGPVAMPRQVYCEIKTVRQMGLYDMYSEEVIEGLEAYNFDTALEWVLDNPEEYVRALDEGMEDEEV